MAKKSDFLIFLYFLGGGNSVNNGAPYSTEIIRKPTRLEALPTMDSRKNSRKRSGPILNTMGTF